MTSTPENCIIPAPYFDDSQIQRLVTGMVTIHGKRLAQSDEIDKAGTVPFFRDEKGQFHYYVMKPKPTKSELGPPEWQLAKGTRQYCSEDGKWFEVKDSSPDNFAHLKPESFARAAVREAKEELNLDPRNIAQLYDLGISKFISESKRTEKEVVMYAAEVINSKIEALNVADKNCPTAECAWMTLEEFKTKGVGRKDHANILESMEKSLKENLDVKPQSPGR